MRAAGLEIVAEIMRTEAVLLSNPKTKNQRLVDTIALRLDGYMTAKRYACVASFLRPRASQLLRRAALTPLRLPPPAASSPPPASYMSYNVEQSALDFAVQITPGLSAPTVQPLAPIKGVIWCSVSAMVARKEVGVAMDKLKALGATGVIVFNLDNYRV